MAALPHGRGTHAVAPRALYGSSGSELLRVQGAWRRGARVGAGLVLGCAVVLLALSSSWPPRAAVLAYVVSPPVLATGGGAVTVAANRPLPPQRRLSIHPPTSPGQPLQRLCNHPVPPPLTPVHPSARTPAQG